VLILKQRLQLSYLVQFGFPVVKRRGVISLGGVAIHKHKSVTTGKETPRFP